MPGPRYVELIRVSSKGQAERDTPQDQRNALDRLRRSRPGTLVERIEQQVSGAAAGEDRPDLRRLGELAAAKAFDEVRVRHLDRLTRHDDPLERAAVLALVRRAGAVIVDAGGSVLDPATMGGELLWVFSTLASAEERRKILTRTLEAKRRLAANGRLTTGQPPWGRAWDRERGWSLTPAAKDYRRLFDLALQGRTLWQIASQLEAEGVSSQRGRPWTAGMVHNLIKARHATGRGTSCGHAIEVPPIVDEATQKAALARLRANDNAGGPHTRYPALLRKILVCGVCGAACHTNRNSGRPGAPPPPPFYYCSARDPGCYQIHRIAAVDEAVRARLKAWLRRPGPLTTGADMEPEGDPEADAAEAAKVLRRLDREEERIARLMRRGLLSEKVAAGQLEEIARGRAAAERQAESAAARADAAERRAEVAADLGARVQELRRGLGRAGFDEWRELVGILFDRSQGYSVAIWPDGRIALRGAVTLDAAGDEQLRKARKARGNAPSDSRIRLSVPVRLDAYAARLRRRTGL